MRDKGSGDVPDVPLILFARSGGASERMIEFIHEQMAIDEALMS